MAHETKAELLHRAEQWCDLTVRCWSPGDGKTRYTFWDREGRQIGTGCLGLKEAWVALYSITAGIRLQVRRTLEG